MMKTISWLLTILILLAPASRTLGVSPQKDKQPPSIETIKMQVAKLGVGEKARATITHKNGAKTKGYIYSAGEDDFVVRDRKTDAPTTIAYTDVARVQPDRGHSKAKNMAIGIGIGVGAFLTVLLIAFSRLND